MSARTETNELCTLLSKQIAEKRLELPMLPTVATEVLQLCQQESTDAAKLSAVIHRDQTLAANVLRVANSAAYVGQVPCGSLQQAVSRLGMQLITDIAVAVAVRGKLFSSSHCADMFKMLWRHSVITGFFTREIARSRRRNVEIAFLTGLLHDIGKAVLLTNIDKHMQTGTVTMDDLAWALQVHHAGVGSMLARLWRMPEQIGECIEFHHDYDNASRFKEQAMTVCLADMVAHLVAPHELTLPLSVEPIRQHPVLLGLNLYADQFEAILAKGDQALALAEGMS